MSTTPPSSPAPPALRVLAIGAFTPVGGDARSTAAAVRAGLCGFREHAYMIDTAGEPMRVAQVAGVDADLRGAERLVALLTPALTEALAGILASAGAANATHDGRIGVAVAWPPTRPGGPDEATDAVRALCRDRLGARLGPLQLFASGHAGGFEALDQARAWLRAGQVDAVVVAGVDSYLAPETLEWLEAEEQLHGAGPLNNAWGFIPGEAAGALLLANAGAATSGGWADVLAVGLGRESKLNKSGEVCIGEGLTQALRRALDEVAGEGVIDNVVCDMNGEAYRADEYGFCGLRVRDRLRDPTDFLAPADCWGDVGAAGLPLHLLLAASAGRKGHAKGPLTLLWGSSDGGGRGAAVIRADVAVRA
ncbi:beta-ketoacyl synthase N-terminal-like domain-containing protein [Roseateles chitinivorans]|uniref:beta-ketoacyl synthase N-terminal-like domain-containing protein n=1 Tax=Roseateles chitinivorans TaxID=2917965 RepID=UPI003D674896